MILMMIYYEYRFTKKVCQFKSYFSTSILQCFSLRFLSRPKKVPSAIHSSRIVHLDDDPCLNSVATESILPLIPDRTINNSGSSPGNGGIGRTATLGTEHGPTNHYQESGHSSSATNCGGQDSGNCKNNNSNHRNIISKSISMGSIGGSSSRSSGGIKGNEGTQVRMNFIITYVKE